MGTHLLNSLPSMRLRLRFRLNSEPNECAPDKEHVVLEHGGPLVEFLAQLLHVLAAAGDGVAAAGLVPGVRPVCSQHGQPISSDTFKLKYG